MANYTDVYLLPIKTENIKAYGEMAEKAGKIFRKHGALGYREYVASDLKVMDGIAAFPGAVRLEAGETLVYAAVDFGSEEQRNEAMKRIFADPELQQTMPKEPIFEMKRMIYGGFAILVEQ